ncbi:MAG: hypothetical protein Q8O14_10680 [bacterium]|nr:hypothetical protein [bacterium]
MLSGHTLIVAGGWVLRLASLILLLVAWRLFSRAFGLGLGAGHFAWLLPLGLALGVFKARRVMRRILAANVAWLRGRERVPAWRVYQPRLLALIATMIALSSWLKLLAAESPWGLAALGGLDLAVGTALGLSAGLHRTDSSPATGPGHP